MKSIFLSPPRRHFRRFGIILFLLLMTTGIKAAKDKYTPYAAEGFSYYINTSASTPYAVIVGIPNQASVTLPPNVSYIPQFGIK